MSQFTLIETHLLNSSGILNYLLKLKLSDEIDSHLIRHHLFLSYHEISRYQPDHFLENKWQMLNEQATSEYLNLGPILILKRLSEMFFCKEKIGNKIKLDRFETWQVLLTRISCLPIQASFEYNSAKESRQPMAFQWPPYPFHPLVEDYIDKEKLHESHQHLNGSSSFEDIWLDAVKSPQLFVASFEKEYYTTPQLRELCEQIDSSLSPETLKTKLEVARCIREILNDFIRDTPLSEPFDKAINPIEFSDIANRFSFPSSTWPTTNPYTQKVEYAFLSDLISSLHQKKSSNIERLLWIYLLIQNQILTLLVQREDFYGFDQFQKYTFTELRELTEKDYTKRFIQAHGKNKKSQVGHLEGRLAPKSTPKKFESLVRSILSGYLNYITGDKKLNFGLQKTLEELEDKYTDYKLNLALVVHFIKQKPKDDEIFPYHHLYQDLDNKAKILLSLLKNYPDLKKWIRGIDAAANELDAPPEVFAPIFRVLKSCGIEHATYHVGEDFFHLASGIRSIDDAIRFLPLSSGDRLGHCTAIGINPNIWSRNLPPKTVITQENYLLDLIFIWRESINDQALLKWGNIAATKALRLAQDIFYATDTSCLTIEHLDQVMDFRDLYPLYEPLYNGGPPKVRPSSIWDNEISRIDNLICQKNHNLKTLELYRLWLVDKNVRKERYKLCEIETTWLPDDVLIALQQKVMKKIAQKNLAIECPPTSNVRISQYQAIHEHHIFRWLGLKEAKCQGDVKMAICLASDDPGIFVADVKTEFYHLFNTLRTKYHMSDSEAIKVLSELNDNSRVYRFHTK